MNRTITASAMAFGIFVGALLVAANLCMADDPTPKNSKTRPGSRLPKSLDLTEDQLKSVSPPSEEAIRRQYGHYWNTPDESAPDWEKDPRILEEAVKEAERLGLDIDDMIIYGDGEGILEAVRKARDEEPQDIRSAEPKLEGDDSRRSDSRSTLDKVSDKRADRRQRRIEDSAGAMRHQADMTQAAHAGEETVRQAADIIESAGREAQAQSDQRARDAAHKARESSWSAVLGDAVVTGIQQGAEAFGATLGAAAADRAAGGLFGSSRTDVQTPETQQDSGSAAGSESTAAPIAGTSGSAQQAPAAGSDHGIRSDSASPTGGAPGRRRARRRKKSPSESGGRNSGASVSADSGTGSEDGRPMVTCPACGRTFRGIAGQGVPCPYCVTMNCPRCGFSKNYPRGQEPSSCPGCSKD